MKWLYKIFKHPLLFISIVACILTVSISLYFVKFHYGFSDLPNDWAVFGNYISGLSAITNVIVFVWLTMTIQKANDFSKERDREHQKRLILTQLRYDEFNSLSKELNSPLFNELATFQHIRIFNMNSLLLAFLRSQTKLFPILKDENVVQKVLQLSAVLDSIGKICAECAGLDQNGIPAGKPKLLPDEFKVKMEEYIQLKAEFISEMEGYIISEIDNIK